MSWRKLFFLLILATGLLLFNACDTPPSGGGGDGDNEYTLVFEEPDHNQIWWPNTTNAGDKLVFEWQLNEYPLADDTEESFLLGEQHYTLCVIGLLDLETGEARRLTNNSSVYNDWLPQFSVDQNWVYFKRLNENTDHRSFCRAPADGREADVEHLSDSSVEIISFDLFRDGQTALMSYYEDGTYKSGIFNLATGNIVELENNRGYASYALAISADEKSYYALTWVGEGESPSGCLIMVHSIGNGVPYRFNAPPEIGGFLRIFTLSPERSRMVVNVGYCFGNVSFIVPLNGGSTTPIVEEPYVNEIHWAADGNIYFCIDGFLWRIRP